MFFFFFKNYEKIVKANKQRICEVLTLGRKLDEDYKTTWGNVYNTLNFAKYKWDACHDINHVKICHAIQTGRECKKKEICCLGISRFIFLKEFLLIGFNCFY